MPLCRGVVSLRVLRNQYGSYEFRQHGRMLSLASADLVLSPLSLALLEKAINSSRYGSIWAFFDVFPSPPDGGEGIVISSFCPTPAVRVPSDSCHLMSFDIVVGPAWGVLLVGFGHRGCRVLPEMPGEYVSSPTRQERPGAGNTEDVTHFRRCK